MTWIRAVLRETLGLFVDDGVFAFAILAWVALAWLFCSLHPGVAAGPILLIGLLTILLVSALRFAGKAR